MNVQPHAANLDGLHGGWASVYQRLSLSPWRIAVCFTGNSRKDARCASR